MTLTATTMNRPQPLEPLDVESAFWALDPRVIYLNHGCFGARPRAVAEAQERLRREFESNPFDLLDRRRNALIDDAKETVGRFIGARPTDFGFVTNATAGINAVLRSMRFAPGEEIVTTSHQYNAVRQTLRFLAEQPGLSIVVAEVPFPLQREAEVTQAVMGSVTERTRMVIIDHVTSPTAVRFPAQEIVNRCRERGVLTLIDGAHAPGMIELDVETIGADFYAGNLHKWACAPVGAAFLWVKPEHAGAVHALVISHFFGEGWAAEASWQGTRDISPWLCAKTAIETLRAVGWDRIRAHNHALAAWGQEHLCARWDVEPASPLDGSLLGSMATVGLPPSARAQYETPLELQSELARDECIEVPVIDFGGRWWIRISCQIYTRAADIERLGSAVLDHCRSK